jgi:hypothetical protein
MADDRGLLPVVIPLLLAAVGLFSRDTDVTGSTV